MSVGPDRVVDAVHAVEAVGLASRRDFYWALHAVLVRRREDMELFEEAFRLFWRDPDGPDAVLDELLPKVEVPGRDRKEPIRRLREAGPKRPSHTRSTRPTSDRIEVDAVMEYSSEETLRTRDFEEMSPEEVEAAKRMLAKLRLPWPDRPTRRYASDSRGGLVDPRRTLRAALRSGGATIPLRWRRVVGRPPVIVALCDISGSMERYSRLLLHFLHALASQRQRVHSFVFGTRLTNVTRLLQDRDVDRALEAVGKAATDWAGGTRIGDCLRSFNGRWSRRVLSQGGVVLLITDGLDLDAGRGLAKEAARLSRSCDRLVWLNPLLRFHGFEPKASGIRAILPHVDDFRPAHDLASLEALAGALST